jgi:hypothetical protein
MALGTFTLKAKGKASSFDPRVNGGKPLIVIPREFRPNFTTQRFPNPKDVVIVDVVDLLADTVHVSVIWGGGAMVDAIKEHVPAEGQEPTKLPVKIQAASSAAGNSYYVLAPLDGAALQLANAWDAKFPQRVDQERARHEAEQGTAAPAADPMAAALAALQGGVAVAQGQPTPLAQAAGVGVTPQDNQAAQVAALQAQLAALQGQAAAPAAPAQPVAQETQAAAPQPAMSDADLEAAIKALG